MDKQVTKNVYVIGDKIGVTACLKAMTGTDQHLNDMITVLPSVTLATDKLNGHDMECDYSFVSSEPTTSGKRSIESTAPPSPRMKKLKPVDYSSSATSDNGYESDTTEPEENQHTTFTICTIVLEEDTGLNAKLASFAFMMLMWPALILLPVGNGTFKRDFYEDFILELGMLASRNNNESKLIVVGISPQDKEAKEEVHRHKDVLQCDISDSYFGKNFDFSEIEYLAQKVKDVMDLKYTCASCQNIIMESDANIITTHKLINDFRRILIDILKTPPVQFTIDLYKFFKHIDNTQERIRIKEDLAKLSLIHEYGRNKDKKITLMPLVCSEIMPEFEQFECEVETNPLKISINLDIIPACLKANIYKALLCKGWFIMSSGPKSCKKDSVLFSKQLQRILVQFKSPDDDTSTVVLCGLKTCDSTECTSVGEYEELRQTIDKELKVFNLSKTTSQNTIQYYVKRKDDKDIENAMKTDEGHWIEVDMKNEDVASNLSEYLSPWFSSEISKIKKELNSKVSDALLADIASLFGKGSMLFFVSEGISQALVDRIDYENPRSVKDAVFRMLKEWLKMKGLGANLSVLRSALEKSTHVIIDLNQFDEIVKEHCPNKEEVLYTR